MNKTNIKDETNEDKILPDGRYDVHVGITDSTRNLSRYETD